MRGRLATAAVCVQDMYVCILFVCIKPWRTVYGITSRGSVPNAAKSPGSKNHVTRLHTTLQPKRLQIVQLMMVMALTELNFALLMMTMLVM